MELLYFNSFAISVNLPDWLVTVICDPALKKLSSFGNGSMLIIILCST